MSLPEYGMTKSQIRRGHKIWPVVIPSWHKSTNIYIGLSCQLWKGFIQQWVGHYRTIWCEVISVEFLQNSKWYFYAVPKSCCPETISCFGSSFLSLILLFGIWWPVDTMAMANTLTTKWSFFLAKDLQISYVWCLSCVWWRRQWLSVGGWVGRKVRGWANVDSSSDADAALEMPKQTHLMPLDILEIWTFCESQQLLLLFALNILLLLGARLAELHLGYLGNLEFRDRQTFFVGCTELHLLRAMLAEDIAKSAEALFSFLWSVCSMHVHPVWKLCNWSEPLFFFH